MHPWGWPQGSLEMPGWCLTIIARGWGTWPLGGWPEGSLGVVWLVSLKIARERIRHNLSSDWLVWIPRDAWLMSASDVVLDQQRV